MCRGGRAFCRPRGCRLPAHGGIDEFSDLDLVVVAAEKHHREVMERRRDIASSWGPLLAAFTGEHVGEPRLLICLYADPLMHVDLKFLGAEELAHRIENPMVLWERDDTLTRTLAATAPEHETIDPPWLEDRFWVWVHYAAAKLGRGELFEVIDFVGFLRGHVLAPLALHVRGMSPRGVRRFEQLAPDLVPAFADTAVAHAPDECAGAIRRCVDLYRALREQLPTDLRRDPEAESAATQYLRDVTLVATSQHRP